MEHTLLKGGSKSSFTLQKVKGQKVMLRRLGVGGGGAHTSFGCDDTRHLITFVV